jgi:hypothetical protein
LRTSVKTIAARQLRLIEESIADGTNVSDPAAIARFLKDVTAAMKTVQDMERNEAGDLTGLSDEEIDAALEEAEAREKETNERLLKALPRSVSEREQE